MQDVSDSRSSSCRIDASISSAFFLFEKFMNKILRVLYVFNVILLEFLNINYILPTP